MTTASQGFLQTGKTSPSQSRPASLPASSNIRGLTGAIRKIVSTGAMLRLNFLRPVTEQLSRSSSSVDEASLFNGGALPIDFTDVELNALKEIAQSVHQSSFGVLESIILTNLQILNQPSMTGLPVGAFKNIRNVQIHLLRHFNYHADKKDLSLKCKFITADDLVFLTDTFSQDRLTTLFKTELECLQMVINEISDASSDDAATSVVESEQSDISKNAAASKVKVELQLTGLRKLQTHLLILQKICTLETQDLMSLSFSEETHSFKSDETIQQTLQFVSLYQLAATHRSVTSTFSPVMTELIKLKIDSWQRRPFEMLYMQLPAFNIAVKKLYNRYEKLAAAIKNRLEDNSGSEALEQKLKIVVDSLRELMLMENFLDKALKSIHRQSTSIYSEVWIDQFEKYLPCCVELLKNSIRSIRQDTDAAPSSQKLTTDAELILHRFNEKIASLHERIQGIQELYVFANYVSKVVNEPVDRLSLYYFYKIDSSIDRQVLVSVVTNISIELERAFTRLIMEIDEMRSRMTQKELDDLKSSLFADRTQFKALLFAFSGVQTYLSITKRNNLKSKIGEIHKTECFADEPLYMSDEFIEALEDILRSFSKQTSSASSTSDPNTEASDEDTMFALEDYKSPPGMQSKSSPIDNSTEDDKLSIAAQSKSSQGEEGDDDMFTMD